MFRKSLIVAAVAASAIVLSTSSMATANAATAPHRVPSAKSALHVSGLPFGVHAAHGLSHTAGSAPANTLLDSDVEIYVGTTNSEYIAGEGHLHLTKSHGSTYTGYFRDNLGADTYKASATGVSTTDETGKYTIYTRNGKFTFKEGTSNSTGTAPSKYGKHAETGLEFQPHVYTVNTGFTLQIGFALGGKVPGTTGALTFTTDSFDFIAPASTTHHIVGKYEYTQGGKKGTVYIHSWGDYEANDAGEPQFAILVLKLNGKTLHIASQEEEGDNDSNELELFGTAGPGHSSTYVEAELTAPEID